ncbi:MAG: hypothetical protein H0W83_02890 [Planctomycetes bacterium]|nr:hypothetical protein [Planctomycetota bacterium]
MFHTDSLNHCHWGAGAGAALLVVGDRMVRACGVRMLWCNARTSAIGFYQKQGWTVVSAVFEIPVAGPHVRMTKALA